MPNYGKYRGKVVETVDPLQLGRIIALVPAISENPLSWALPATPYAGRCVGFFALPPLGANVWIEFEGGMPIIPSGRAVSGVRAKCQPNRPSAPPSCSRPYWAPSASATWMRN